ncbi:sulfotransferase family protein [Dactylosporangium sp. CA-092794]|uniref:sulfotransferase family protein n=1 Tax=Dactylosporangium sp. CA-092794 TaxID=3239929 RepID=UPI003D92174C
MRDFRPPLLMRSVERAVRPFAARRPLDAARLKRRAQAKTGLTDFGDTAPLDEPLEILCESINTETDLSAIGRIAVGTQFVNTMSTRLRLVDLIARRPELFTRPVTAPLFVAGMPRSGTTFLQRLMSRDKAWYTLPFWELVNPIPAGPGPRGGEPDPRIKAGERLLRTARRLAPNVHDIHPTENEEPEEELQIMAAGHAAASLGSGHYPAYTRWYLSADHTGAYRQLRQFLQAMQGGRTPGGRWLLKCPSHLEMLRPLLAVFDDANVVLTHRDPIASITSLAALDIFAYGPMLRRPDPNWFGALAVDFIERALRSMVDYRDSAEGVAQADRFVDVAFADLTGDPMGTVARISAAAGREPDAAAVTAMREYAGRTDQHRSRQKFTLADFGLEKTALRERFKFYYDRFDVPAEGD